MDLIVCIAGCQVNKKSNLILTLKTKIIIVSKKKSIKNIFEAVNRNKLLNRLILTTLDALGN